jgi:hypothetical protein
MTKRILLAGLLGGIAMFIWASIAHMALPLGSIGMREMPEDAALLTSMRSTLGERSGFYVFPGVGGDADMKKYEQKLASSPSGLLIYHPPGAKGLTPGQLVTEFSTELVEALLLAWLMAQTRAASFASRMGVALAVAVVAAITTNISYWNWYGFPAAYTFAYMGIQMVGFVLAGLVAARMLGRPSAKGMALAA